MVWIKMHLTFSLVIALMVGWRGAIEGDDKVLFTQPSHILPRVHANENGRVTKAHILRFSEFVPGFSRPTWRTANCLTMEINRSTKRRRAAQNVSSPRPEIWPHSFPPFHFWIVSSDRWYRYRSSLFSQCISAMRNSGLAFPLTYFQGRVNGRRKLEPLSRCRIA